MEDEDVSFVEGVRERLIRFWDHVAWLARALWACRVSVLSGLAGVILFWVAVPAQNLFADQSFAGLYQVLYWLGVFALVFLVWAFPIHYNARRTLDKKAWLLPYRFRAHLGRGVSESVVDKLRVQHGFLTKWTPRIIALLPFVAILFGLRGAWDALDGAGALPQAVEARTQLKFLFALDVMTAALFLAFVVFRQPLLKRVQARLEARRPNTDQRGKSEIALEWFYRVSAALTLLVFLVAYFWPELLADRFPRAMLAPLLLGSLVLFLGWIAREGDRRGFPALAALLAICVLTTGLNTRLNDVRTLAKGDKFEDRQIDFPEAVKNWRVANGCADPAPASSCPPALIVAAEGGASRAAFMTATVVGHLMDRDGELGDDPDLKSPGRRIFAISGVSGGSVGAVVIRAAIEDSLTKTHGKPPCANDQRNWFQNPVGEPNDSYGTSWRSCLQLLVGGDFLSSAFVGFGFRDNFAPPYFGIEDRAALLEQAWERHYDYVVNEPPSWPQIGRDCDATSREGLCRSFGYAKDRVFNSAKNCVLNPWAPLLLLNGTSVNSGRRIVVSDLVSTRPDKDETKQERVPLYSAAFDFFEMTSTGCWTEDDKVNPNCPAPGSGRNDVPALRDGADIRLSTAALVSARFPVLSPAGVIRAKGRPDFGDRVVDGGYFEDAGLTTALDVARALKVEGITPFILWIQNEPITPPGFHINPPRADASPSVTEDEDGYVARLFGLAAAPFETLISTRSGHEYEEADVIDRDLHEMNKQCLPDYQSEASFYQVGVHADPDLKPPSAEYKHKGLQHTPSSNHPHPLAIGRIRFSIPPARNSLRASAKRVFR